MRLSNLFAAILMTALGAPTNTVVDAFISSSCSPSTHSQQHRRSTELFVLQEKLSSEEIQARLKSQLEKLREKDRASGPYSAKVSSIVLIMSTGGPRC